MYFCIFFSWQLFSFSFLFSYLFFYEPYFYSLHFPPLVVFNIHSPPRQSCRILISVWSPVSVFSADNENHTKGDSPKTSSASGPQEQLWRGSQVQAQTQTQAQAQTQTQTQAQVQAHSSVKLQIQPQNITQRNHTLGRKYCHYFINPLESVYIVSENC